MFHLIFVYQGRPDSNVTARGLVVENPRTRDIIKFHSSYYKNVSEVNFNGDVLVYVAPVSGNIDNYQQLISWKRSLQLGSCFIISFYVPSNLVWVVNSASYRSDSSFLNAIMLKVESLFRGSWSFDWILCFPNNISCKVAKLLER